MRRTIKRTFCFASATALIVGALSLVLHYSLYPKLRIEDSILVSDLGVTIPVKSTIQEYYLVFGKVSPSPSYPGFMVHGLYKVVSKDRQSSLLIKRQMRYKKADTFDAIWQVLPTAEVSSDRSIEEVESKEMLILNFKPLDSTSVELTSNHESILTWAHDKPRSDGIILFPHREFLAVATSLDELKRRYPISKLQPRFKWRGVAVLDMDDQTKKREVAAPSRMDSNSGVSN